jgi:hypothetical protein
MRAQGERDDLARRVGVLQAEAAAAREQEVAATAGRDEAQAALKELNRKHAELTNLCNATHEQVGLGQEPCAMRVALPIACPTNHLRVALVLSKI